MKGDENNGLGWAGWAGLCPRIPWLAPGPAGIAVIDGAACVLACVLGPQLELRALPAQMSPVPHFSCLHGPCLVPLSAGWPKSWWH